MSDLSVSAIEARERNTMDCTEVRELLSAYFDDELSSDNETAVAEHLEGCGDCSAELAGFERLSDMARGWDTPAPPAQIWTQLEQQLDETQDEQTVQPAIHRPFWSLPVPRLVSLTASIMLAVGLGWFGYSTWFEHGEHDGFTVEFGHYLEEFHRDPVAAQQFLLANYESQAVDAEQAGHQVGYRPAVAGGLPERYSVESTYVMKMPCCTCVQSLCKRSDDSTIAIFEHDDDEMKNWFGDRPEMTANCNGKRCSLVELNDRIAASWKRDKRRITVVGLRDIAELTELVAWFDEQKHIKLQ